MTTFSPLPPYTREEIAALYPANLQLEQVQILARHGERSPVGPRFGNLQHPTFWPYCKAARMMQGLVKTPDGFEPLIYRRRLETFGPNDEPIITEGPKGERDDICAYGELTDKGRDTTYALGQRLRTLYVDQLKFMPDVLENQKIMYIRASPITRATESTQQMFVGMYPGPKREWQRPVLVTRGLMDESLYPNDSACPRFRELVKRYGEYLAPGWNKSSEMALLQKKIGKHMPAGKVELGGSPRLSGVLDSVNSTRAHGPATKLPPDFYEPDVLNALDKIVTNEWFQGYKDNQEYRMLGVGGLAGDVVTRMIKHVEYSKAGASGITAGQGIKGEAGHIATMRRPAIFGLSGTHDTALAGFLSSFGAFDDKWPPYTSHIAIELFKEKETYLQAVSKYWWKSFQHFPINITSQRPHQDSIGRVQSSEINDADMSRLDGYYVRIRYNDVPVVVAGCRKPGNHLEGDESFCTLKEFKRIADKFTPKNWKTACNANLGVKATGKTPDIAGFS